MEDNGPTLPFLRGMRQMESSDLARLRERYLALNDGEWPAPPGAIEVLESVLGVTLPADLKEIARFCSGGIGEQYSFEADGPGVNVLNETQRIRTAINLPHRYIILAEPPESLVVLDTEAAATGGPVVIWCDACDVERLDDLASLLRPPDTWPSYAAYFAYLIEEEEDWQRDMTQTDA